MFTQAEACFGSQSRKVLDFIFVGVFGADVFAAGELKVLAADIDRLRALAD